MDNIVKSNKGVFMSAVLSLIGALSVAYVIYKVIASLFFRYKALKIILNDLNYNAAVPGWQAQFFLDAIKVSKSMNGNEYDAAIIFMLSQLSVMTSSEDEADVGETDSSRNFKIEKYALIEKIVEKSKFGDELISDHVKLKE